MDLSVVGEGASEVVQTLIERAERVSEDSEETQVDSLNRLLS